jgi:hypothetical protein
MKAGEFTASNTWIAATEPPAAPLWTRLALGVAVFAVLGSLILSKPAWPMLDFDQNFYISIADDLDRYGVFSNGVLSDVDRTAERPAPGMFFGPVFPTLVYAVMKLDPHFAESVRCSLSADSGLRQGVACKPDEAPIRVINALLLAIGVVAVASTAELMFRQRWMFMLSGLFALAALACEVDIFSYIMTEATIFSIYSMFSYGIVLAWKSGRTRYFIVSGGLLGLLCLTKPSFLIAFPLVATLSTLYILKYREQRPHLVKLVLAFGLAFVCLTGGWMARNLVAVGKFGFTQEYGAAALIERFAYDDMSPREFFQAFAYCTPGLGELAFDHVNGADSMHRFKYFTKGSFFNVGRDRRDALVEKYGRLDPLIAGIALQELRTGWWRYLLTSIPLTWCGMWAGWIAALLLVPLFAWACIGSMRTGRLLFPFYAAPALANLVLDGLIGNHYTRYNLVLIGPYAVGAAAIISSLIANRRRQSRFHALEPLSAPAAPAASGEDSASPGG